MSGGKQIKILLALNVPFDSERGGLERSSVNLIKYLSKQSSIRCFCAFNKFVDKIDNTVEIETTINSYVDLKDIIYKHKIDIVLLPGGPWYSLMARQAIVGTNCKIITAWHFSPGVRLGNTFNEAINSYKSEKDFINKLKLLIKLFFFPVDQYRMNYIDRKSFRNAYRLSDAFVVLASSYINSFKTIYNFTDTNKLIAINNSLSFDESISFEEIYNKEKTVLIVARFDESSKRLTYALKVWKLLEDKNPDWKLQVVGDGKDRGLYESLIKKWNLKRVFFEGRQAPKEYYKKASIFFMTSRHEGWPLTLIEAQQMGCIPIAMNSFSSLQDIIIEGINGYIVTNKNISEFAMRTQMLMSNEDLRNKMASNAVKNSSRFSPEIIGQQWIELFQNVNK